MDLFFYREWFVKMAQTEDQIEGFSYQNFASVLLKFINIKKYSMV